MAKTRISIYLIKEGLTDHDSILRLDKCDNVQVVDGVGVLYSRMSYTRTPRWVGSVFGTAIDATIFGWR